ncbi:hypothetical protein FRC18_008887 [Serendipita sp. 400]|nr:hypothetical protein FRC18_008887 [Serendipita sp. 400]
MVNWSDPAVVQKCAVIFSNLGHVCAGAYVFDICVAFIDYDWAIITRKRPWKHTMLLYFLCKYTMFFAIIGMLIALNTTTPINCQALYTFNQFFGSAAIGTASTLLMLRTIAIWNKNLAVTIPLVLIALGHWSILMYSVTSVRSVYVAEAKTCVVLSTGNQHKNLTLNLVYLYTMFVDLVVLVISTIGLLLTPGRSSLWKLLFKDGIVFFITAFVCNALAASVLLLDLNPVMNLMFSIPAACLTAGAAARSYIRLSNWSNQDVFVHNSSNPTRTTRKGGMPDRHVATNMSAVNWSRPKPTDIELGVTRDDSSDDYKGGVRSVGFERGAPHADGIMITTDTFTNDEITRKNNAKRTSTSSSLDFDSSRIPEEPTPSTHTYGKGIPSAGARW